MKRGKDDEKSVGPMFPRLHVNDTAEKGGPRAPPRNKMALYEQLSIPSQRFGSGVVPLNPQDKPSFVSSASLIQGSGGSDRNTASTTMQWSEKFPVRQPDETVSSAAQFERKKKLRDEDDFAVPVFVQQSKSGKGLGKIHSFDDGGNMSSISSAVSGQLEEQRITSVENVDSAKADGSTVNLPARENDASMKEASEKSSQDYGVHALPSFSSRLHESDASLHRESRIEAQVDGPRQSNDLIPSTRHNLTSVSYCGEEHGQSNTMCNSLQLENADKSDDVSETSMVDSATGLDITPDDVVGIIGQKHFWKARKAIVNQQRVFAVQVFELHRLIKVQRLIAGSPHILIEENVFLGRSATHDSPIKKVTPEFVTKPPPSAADFRDDSEKPSHKRECSTVNTVEKTVLSSAKTGSQSVNYGPYTPQPPPQPQPQPPPQPQPQQQVVSTNHSKMNPWYFHQPPGGAQWLVPVMSPSEGLVYKPYTGPGVPGSVYGGYGPFSPIPMSGNYSNSSYGVPTPHPQAVGGFHGASPAGHMYFPTYGTPVSNPAMSGSAVEQASHYTGPSAQSQTGPAGAGGGGGVGVNAEQQSSCTAPSHKIRPVPQPKVFQASTGSDAPQGSTASSRLEVQKRARTTNHNSQGKDDLHNNPLPLFPESPRKSVTRAIKVVPHNPRSATESAARIFRFIQEERQQNDAV